MSLENAKEISEKLIKEKDIINKSKRNIKEAEKILETQKEIKSNNVPIYIGIVLLLLTLVILSFLTVKIFVPVEEEVVATTTIINNHYTSIQQVNKTFVNIEAKEEMICLFKPNATEGKCYRKVRK